MGQNIEGRNLWRRDYPEPQRQHHRNDHRQDVDRCPDGTCYRGPAEQSGAGHRGAPSTAGIFS